MKLEHLERANEVFNDIASLRHFLKELEEGFAKACRFNAPEMTGCKLRRYWDIERRTKAEDKANLPPKPAALWSAPTEPLEAYKAACVESLKSKIAELEKEAESL